MPNDFFYPQLPTQYATPGKKSYTNKDLSERTKLGVTIERPSMQALREEGPDVEALLAAAKQTLADTQPTAASLTRTEYPSNTPQEKATIRRGQAAGFMLDPLIDNPLRDAGRNSRSRVGQVAGAFGEAVGDQLSEMTSPVNLGTMAAIEAVPAVRAARTAASKAAEPTFNELAHELQGPRARFAGSGPQGGIPPVEHYWDALDLGFSPAKAARSAAGSDKGARASLKGLQEAGSEARANMGRRGVGTDLAPETDLTSELSGLAEAPLSPAEIAQARSAERFGKTYRSEGGAAAAQSAPTAVYLGEQEALNPGDAPTALYNIVGGDMHGGTVSAETLNSLGIPVPPTPQPSGQSLNVLRESPMEALAAKDEASRRSVMFGGPFEHDNRAGSRFSSKSKSSKLKPSKSR